MKTFTRLGFYKSLGLGSSKELGTYVRATGNICKGQFLCEYAGEVLSKEEFLWNDVAEDLFQLTDDKNKEKLQLVISAQNFANIGRFFNGINNCQSKMEIKK